jgi:putative DNA primase/helicase
MLDELVDIEIAEPACSGSEKKASDPFHAQKLAKRFIEKTGILPAYYRNQLYRYDGCRYVLESEIACKLRRFLQAAKVPHNNMLIGNIIPHIQALAYRDSSQFAAMPFYVGSEPWPRPADVIGYRNGLLDVAAYMTAGDASLRPHTAKWISTICLPYDFDPSANCPHWQAFLDQVFEGDEGRKALLQEFAGYCLVQDTSMHKLLLLIGPPRGGKGTTLRVIEGLVGPENATGYSLHSLAERFGLAQLVGKLVAFVGEVNLANSRDKYNILEKLNGIVGGDSMEIEEKYMAGRQSMALPTRFVLAANELPAFVDPTGALAARMLILDYPQSFEGREDRGLTDRLLSEISGINAWALNGYRRLKSQGAFTTTEHARQLVNAFRRDNSDALAFLQDRCVVERGLNPGNLAGVQLSDAPVSITSDELATAYVEWAEARHKDPKPAWLFRELKQLMPKLGSGQRIDGNTRTRYRGIGLIPVDVSAPKSAVVGDEMSSEQFQRELDEALQPLG